NFRWLAGCGKTHLGLLHRGRAALQRRVSRAKSVRALAPVTANHLNPNFFRSLLEVTRVAERKPAMRFIQNIPAMQSSVALPGEVLCRNRDRSRRGRRLRLVASIAPTDRFPCFHPLQIAR